MTTTQLILSIVSAVIGVLGGAAGGNAMSKRNSVASDMADTLINDVYEELDLLHSKFAKFSAAVDQRVTSAENALKKQAPQKPAAKKPAAKKPAAPAAKKATPKKK